MTSADFNPPSFLPSPSAFLAALLAMRLLFLLMALLLLGLGRLRAASICTRTLSGVGGRGPLQPFPFFLLLLLLV